MRVAIFGGAFDPVHIEHVKLVRAAIEQLRLDKVIVMPSFLSPHKQNGGNVSAQERYEMCRIAFRNVHEAEVSDFELLRGETSYSYVTCGWLAERYPSAERFFLVGADMLDYFPRWVRPREILRFVRLAACGRGVVLTQKEHDKFLENFGTDFSEVNFTGKEISSTGLRVALAFPNTDLSALDEEVLAYIEERGLYRFPAYSCALELEKPERRAHSYRVARMACARARSLGIKEEKALLSAMLHDCGKSLSLEDPLLSDFCAPKNVPDAVMHQFSGAFLAEHKFGITDEEILDAIRYHTSGKPDMSPLGKLIFLSDLLEEGRHFEGVAPLRKLFWVDLDACLERALEEQLNYLRRDNKPIFPLTELAYRWILEHKS